MKNFALYLIGNENTSRARIFRLKGCKISEKAGFEYAPWIDDFLIQSFFLVNCAIKIFIDSGAWDTSELLSKMHLSGHDKKSTCKLVKNVYNLNGLI